MYSMHRACGAQGITTDPASTAETRGEGGANVHQCMNSAVSCRKGAAKVIKRALLPALARRLGRDQ